MPALLGVGFIIGPKISAYMLAGAVIGWFGFIPLIFNIGSMGEVIMYPDSVPISELGYWGIWNYFKTKIWKRCRTNISKTGNLY